MPSTFPLGHSLGALLTSYVDGALPPSAARTVSGHLRECDACGAEVASLLRLGVALRAIRSPPLGAATRTRLVGAFRSARLGT